METEVLLMKNVIKRNGKEVKFDVSKIVHAIEKANHEVDPIFQLNSFQIQAAAESVVKKIQAKSYAVNVEEIQDMVETAIMEMRGYEVAQKYVRYRYKREMARKANSTDDDILALIDQANEELKQENSNKNPVINSTQRDYMAGEVSKDLTRRLLLPEDIVHAHEEGMIHFHDSDYYAQKEHNCDLINLEDMLQNGTVISETMIEKPHSFFTACNVTTQIVAQVASNQYGGQSFTLSHLAPFVDISRQKIREAVIEERKETGESMDEEIITKIVNRRLREEIKSGIQTIQYQLITLMTCNGQAPFVTMFMYLDEVEKGPVRDDLALIIEEVLRQRMQGVKNEKGVWITPAFPKLIYVLDEDNIFENSPYYYLTELSAKCTAKRMVPDYISAKKMKEYKGGDVYPCMGCRSFLTEDKEGLGENGKHKYYGRFNQGVVTINLVDVACSSEGDMEKFWEILDERLALCHKALRLRHERLLGTVSDVAPILWQYGALARLKKGETIDKLLFNNYSTISLGYAGLYEMCVRMLGVSHTTEQGREFSLKVMEKLNEACKTWRAAENISYSVYGTPMESTTYKFAKALKKRFGEIPGVTDKNYITNSYHVHVSEKIDAFSKLSFEADFQKLSPGGAISYVEVPNLQNNIPAVLSLMKFIYENIMYAELNTKSDYCCACGFDGEIQIIEDSYGKLQWRCPNCGNTNQEQLSVARRTCGYIGTQFWNQGRTQEIKDRVLHL
ncbi:anaerobic ribonucleoside-triphosphate reductase [Oribacterium parvum ACB1]|uniref:Anaerobic ribonucleoside-triphosphate reductase n=1 Tax=Oribacterium parvum ACB1 TaxID=796943 RepID=G9WNV4_9FIRM|nr:anaerobic ribonucleoside-triphosphate reductase [Oribacterium parvum]EHL10841.1 anaerobic ribonucleoside-triphosphate reductase [Oribacterium parvum ACB1]EJF12028.1 anaerobic ribonucleoside-triphosphate reductase [Oribacterium parvum ACB8]